MGALIIRPLPCFHFDRGDFDFDFCARSGHATDFENCAGGARVFEPFVADGGDFTEVGDVGEEDLGAHDVIHVSAGGFEDLGDGFEGALCLPLDVVGGDGVGVGVFWWLLAGDKNEMTSAEVDFLCGGEDSPSLL